MPSAAVLSDSRHVHFVIRRTDWLRLKELLDRRGKKLSEWGRDAFIDALEREEAKRPRAVRRA